MADLRSSEVCLRFFGDDLDPDRITELLGVLPTVSYRKGEKEISSRGHELTHFTGCWQLHAGSRSPGMIDEQIREILDQLNPDPEVWKSLSKFDPDLFCGLFLKNTNGMDSIEVTTLAAIAARGIGISLDIYGGSDDDDDRDNGGDFPEHGPNCNETADLELIEQARNGF